MTLVRLALRNLLFHWRGNLAVFLGVVVGTAVLTGALLVGDSLRGSLRQLTLERLGWVDQALVGARFVRQSLADDLPAERVAPAIVLQATADRSDGGSVRRVTLYGVDQRFGVTPPGEGVVLSAALAHELGAKVDDTVTFRAQKASELPRDNPFAQRDDKGAFEALKYRVTAVLPEGDAAGRFNLQPSPEAPRNAFVSLASLQEDLEQPGHVNALFVGGAKADLAATFRGRLDLEDWGLRLQTPLRRADALFKRYDVDGDGKLRPSEWRAGVLDRRPQTKFATTYARGILGLAPDAMSFAAVKEPILKPAQFEKFFQERYPYLSLESRQLILEPTLAKAALEAADEAGLRAAPTLVYLCKLDARKVTIAGVVAAVDPTLDKPLGPFLPEGKKSLADDEIALIDWKFNPSLPTLTLGDEVKLTFKQPEYTRGTLEDKRQTFRFAGYVRLPGGAADDPDLTPPFPGITDKDNPGEWKLPFDDPDDPQWTTRIVRRQYGETLYWSEQRTTPRAYITLAAGQKLWASRFGDLTSIRLAPKDGGDLEAAATRFRTALLKRLDPEAGGLVLLAVKDDALKASAGGTDFSELFLGFSFFLIAAALLLVGLLFRLNLDRRASEIGLLLASGYRPTTVQVLLLTEGSILSVLGSAVGVGAALIYSALLVRWLGSVWPGGTLQSLLQPHARWTSLVIGFVGSLAVSVLTITGALYGLSRLAPAALLAGQTSAPVEAIGSRPKWSSRIAILGFLGGLALLGVAPFVPGHEAKAGSFFGAGALLLTAALSALSAWMRRDRHKLVSAVSQLGVRNAARNPVRSMLTAGLLASAAFLIVAVEAFRRSADTSATGRDSPSGGFALLAESDLPVLHDPSTEKGRAEIEKRLRARWTNDEEVADAMKLLEQTTIYSLRVRAGDDASCLNLYQPRRPRVFGVPSALIERGGFTFTHFHHGNPWQALYKSDDPVPAFGEQNTVVWMLKSGVDKTVDVPDQNGTLRPLRISALLHDSVFQSGLLISEDNFKRLYRDSAGYNFFLIAPPMGKEHDVKRILETAFADRGFEVTPTSQRLESFLAVENTYLSTFQALGGLGLLLGSLGLAVVLLRGVWERRAELALLRALGYRRGTLGRLVLAENGFLLLVGLASGTMAALFAVAPHLFGQAGNVPWLNLAALLGLVALVGLATGALAVAATLRAPLIPALRKE